MAREAQRDDAESERSLMRALFTESPFGLHILDPDLRVVRVNPASVGLSGTPAEDIVGHGAREVYRLSDPEAADAMVRRVITTGEPVLDRLVRSRPRTDPEREHLYSTSVFRLEDPGGRVLGAAVTAIDVTDRERARSRTAIVNAGRERVGRTLSLETTCRELVDVLVPAFADAAVVDLFEPVLRGEEAPSPAAGPSVPLRRTAAKRFAGVHEEGGQGQRGVPTDGLEAPRLFTREDTGSWPALPDEARSAIVTPLALRGAVLGTVTCYRTAGRDAFEQDDLDVALHLTARTALCLDNARHYTREHTVALALQRPLPADSEPDRTAVETAAFRAVTGAGGGWFDIIPLSSARVALTVGQVTGPSLHVATAMGQLRTTIQTLAAIDLDPDEMLSRLNDTVARLAAELAALPGAAAGHPYTLRASCVYAIYDPLTEQCAIAGAGHPPPVLAYPDGTARVLDIPATPPLGDDNGDHLPFAVTDLGLPSGSLLALCTDDFLARGTGPAAEAVAGPERLRLALTHPQRPLDELCTDLVRAASATPEAADAVLLLARTRALDAGNVAQWELPHHPTSAATARAHIRRRLGQWNLDDLAFTTELVASELVTNAVRYGAPPIRLRLIKERALTCEVSDSSPAAPHLRHARTVDENGRGLYICAELTRRWGVRYTPGGKTIWTEQDLPPAAGPRSSTADRP
ncbi:SpoIIE family protein phosphatase [Streptomyces atratus]|uniref:SpoIIE family protein phosphatase n=1 Tax=Streptomyces atratus TaxID=1893 RepID=UPI0033E74EEC